MEYLLGFIIAAAIGLTGVGAGVITTPVLILFLHVPAAQAVGTALIFSTVVKLLAAPVYVSRKQVHWKTLALLVGGGLPGVLAGSLLLEHFNMKGSEGLLYSVLGLTIVTMATVNLFKMLRGSRQRETNTDRSRWLPAIALPIGAEVGFSSAGAGALGSIALLGLTTLTAGQVVGTDMFFGLAMSTIGGSIQLHAGNYAPELMWKLIGAGIPGAILGANLASRLPSRPLRYALSVWIIGLGAQLCYRGLAG
jgi:uncharacterized membrane protein YfcA